MCVLHKLNVGKNIYMIAGSAIRLWCIMRRCVVGKIFSRMKYAIILNFVLTMKYVIILFMMLWLSKVVVAQSFYANKYDKKGRTTQVNGKTVMQRKQVTAYQEHSNLYKFRRHYAQNRKRKNFSKAKTR